MNYKSGIFHNKIFTTFIKIIFSLFCIWFIVRKINVSQLAGILAHINLLFLFIAVATFAFSKYISSVRLNFFLKAINIELPELVNLKLYWLGMFYNLFLPGGIGGDGYKVYILKKEYSTISTKSIVYALFIDRLTGILPLFILLVLLSYYLPYPVVYKYFIWVAIPGSIITFYFFLRFWGSQFLHIFNKTHIISYGVQISQIVSVIFIMLALNHFTHTGEYLCIFLLSSIVAVIPITIGGMGSRELVFFMGAQWLGLDNTLSVTISFLFFMISAIVSGFGVIFSFNNVLKNSSYVQEYTGNN
jgi:glycosyltransferase 2 family protein